MREQAVFEFKTLAADITGVKLGLVVNVYVVFQVLRVHSADFAHFPVHVLVFFLFRDFLFCIIFADNRFFGNLRDVYIFSFGRIVHIAMSHVVIVIYHCGVWIVSFKNFNFNIFRVIAKLFVRSLTFPSKLVCIF